MSAITAKASRKMKKYAVLTREPRCFLGSFDFSWEQRKAKELCNIGTGKSNTQDQVEDGIYPFYIRSDIPVKSNKYLYDCEAVITIGDGNIGRVFHYVNGKFDLHQRCYKMTDFQDIWGKYFYYFFSTRFYDRAMKMTAKATVDSVRLEMISEMDIWKPTAIDEQKKIAEFFANLDNLITLHQRKCVFLFGLFQASISMIFTASTFSWEQRKLGELALFNPKDELPQTFEYVDLESVVGTEMLSHRTEVKSSAPSRAQRLAHTGDLFYQTVRPYQKNNYLFEKPDNNYVFSTGYAQMRPYVDGYFLLSLVQSERFVKVVLDNCTGTSYPAINANDLAEIEVAAPSDESEAQKIGTIFRSIDNLITLHQRECISFTVRAGGLILTANKKRTTSSWEQRKLSEITDKVTEKNAGLQYIETFTNSAEFGIISQRDFFDHDIAKLGSLDGYYIVKNEDFVYNPRISTSAPVGPINRNKLGRTGVMSPLYTVFRPHDIDTTYLEYFFKCGYWHSFMNFNGDSGARSDRFSIRDNVFFQMPIPIPDIDEQRKIGELLTCLDNLITLHQRKPFLMKWRTSDANRNQTNRFVL